MSIGTIQKGDEIIYEVRNEPLKYFDGKFIFEKTITHKKKIIWFGRYSPRAKFLFENKC